MASHVSQPSICRRFDSLTSLKEAIKKELRGNMPEDIRMWVFRGDQLELPQFDDDDSPLSILLSNAVPSILKLASVDSDNPALETGRLFSDIPLADDSELTADAFMSDEPNSFDNNLMF